MSDTVNTLEEARQRLTEIQSLRIRLRAIHNEVMKFRIYAPDGGSGGKILAKAEDYIDSAIETLGDIRADDLRP